MVGLYNGTIYNGSNEDIFLFIYLKNYKIWGRGGY